MNINQQFQKLRKTLKQSRRVIKIATKPEKEEFWAVAKVTLLGMLVIGVIGYIIKSVNILLT